MTAMLTSGAVDPAIRVALGGIVETVTEEARQESADLVIIGRGWRSTTPCRLNRLQVAREPVAGQCCHAIERPGLLE